MSNITKKTDINKIIPTKTFFHRNQKSFQYQNTLSPKLHQKISQNIDKNIKSQINKIKFEFNNYTNHTLIRKELSSVEKQFKRKFNYKMNNKNKKMRNQRSYDNLPIKNIKIKENNIQDKNEGIKYNYSLKVLKTNVYKIYKGNKIKSVDIDLNMDNITTQKNNFSLIIKNNQFNKRKTSNSKNIKKRKTEFTYKTKNIKNKYTSFNTENNVIDKIKKFTNPNTIISKCFKTNKSEINHKKEKSKDRIVLNLKQNQVKKYKLNKKVERRKLSFDLLNNIEKNINIETIGKFSPKTYRNNEKNNLIKSSKNILKGNKKLHEPQKTGDIFNISLNTETEQNIDNGINQIKINNYIINKPKEENLKFSSLKFYDNEERTDRASDISKIIIGQIEGYKDIIDQDKSKSIMELLSKVSFSYAKNNNNINKQSIENAENINSNFFFDDINYINSNNKEINNINITNIKNVDEDYDSEDLSNIISNNIKSINIHSKEYIYNRKIKFNYKSNIKTSMNTNNTTISSKEKNNNHNIKSNNINENIISPIKIETRNKNSNNKISNFNLYKREKYFQNKLDKNTLKINKNELKRNLNLALSKQLNSMKSTVNVHKKIDTNSIFNSPKKSKKKIKPKFINDINIDKNKSQMNNIYIKEELNKNKKNEKNEIKNKISNNSLISTIINNGDNETIVNACFNDVEDNICNNNKNINKNINKEKNTFNQCILI